MNENWLKDAYGICRIYLGNEQTRDKQQKHNQDKGQDIGRKDHTEIQFYRNE